jgi:undecaprenyl diphosphate synthase
VSSDKDDRARQDALKARGPLPAHIAVIMDGNGRWARQKGKPRVQGHRAGIAAVRDVTEASAELRISNLTLYTFSTENWSRPATEVNALMQLLIRSLEKEAKTLQDNNIRFTSIGDRSMLPPACRLQLERVIQSTAGNTGMVLTLALSYSGRWELVQAAKSMTRDAVEGTLDPEHLDESVMRRYLNDPDLPDPDLLIRTGGERRISNFLLWQLAYSELHFTEVFWPDFRRNHLYSAIEDFQDRERRFGRVDGSG